MRIDNDSLGQVGAALGGLLVVIGETVVADGDDIAVAEVITNLGRTGKRAGIISRSGNGRYILLPGDNNESPRLNGTKVSGSGEELKNGDVIEAAGSRMQFYLK